MDRLLQNVIQELSADGELDFARVIARVQDWSDRIDGLYRDVRAWLPDYRFDAKEHVTMNEQVMVAFGVPPVSLPVLRISADGSQRARLVPRGPWIIGANGRIDLFTQTEKFLVVDRSDNFQMPDWHIAPFRQRSEEKRFSKDALSSVLRL